MNRRYPPWLYVKFERNRIAAFNLKRVGVFYLSSLVLEIIQSLRTFVLGGMKLFDG